MALAAYRKKRDFRLTREPKGEAATSGGSIFVVQKHAARRLHYDLRLEMKGVLLSWAVTRGPSLVPGEKRLAVAVEDHPVEYAGFEGDIPKGEYGGGSVIVWDKGEWTPVGDAAKGLAKGHLEFRLDGLKLGGRWHLVRIAGKPGEKRVNWLLIKAEDEAARAVGDADILEERPESVLSRRVLDGDEPPARAKNAKKSKPKPVPSDVAAMPEFVEPALATLRTAPPRGKAWIHEIKFDGYRLQARIRDGRVALLTRSGLDWTERFGREIPADLAALQAQSALIDCEAVVENDAGASDFAALQAALSAGSTEGFVLYAFDLLHLDGRDLRAAPLVERKQALERLLAEETGSLRLSRHFDEGGDMVLRHSCRLSLEGIVSKRRDAPYASGRTDSWIKSKCSARQEFVVAGYVPHSAADLAIGSLVLGVHAEGKLRIVGRVGTGFTAAIAKELHGKLEPLKVERSPFAGRLTALQRRDVRFVQPELVAEVEFRGWTGEGQLRHASFRGLREDKPARDIVRETPQPASETADSRRSVRLTSPARVLWPDAGVTKAMLADYYATVWPQIAPFVVGRPLSLLRCPDGIDGESFFQKHVTKGMSSTIQMLRDPLASRDTSLIGIAGLDGLLALVQNSVLEIHPWGATAADLDRPDMLTVDLDPGEGVAWSEMIGTARAVRERLVAAGLAAFVKTSGGKGLHVVSPLRPAADWQVVKAFAKAFAESMARDDPGRYVAVVAKAKRKGRILIDYLRNQRGATAVAAYSTRARPGAPVSMPLRWEELDGLENAAFHTLSNTPDRLSSVGHAWPDFRKAAAPIEARSAKRAA